jgi:hypothetical protein
MIGVAIAAVFEPPKTKKLHALRFCVSQPDRKSGYGVSKLIIFLS